MRIARTLARRRGPLDPAPHGLWVVGLAQLLRVVPLHTAVDFRHARQVARTVEAAADFVPLSGDRYCFPDFTITSPTGFAAAIELFHPWHESHLTARLAQLEELDSIPFILGVALVR